MRSSFIRRVRTLFADRRGNSDLTTYMLLTAAGAAMVGLTLPSLFDSSKSASRTFENQVNVLERGANPGGGSTGIGGAGGGSGWTFDVGKDGVSVSGPGGAGNLNIAGNSGQSLQQTGQNIKPSETSLVQ